MSSSSACCVFLFCFLGLLGPVLQLSAEVSLPSCGASLAAWGWYPLVHVGLFGHFAQVSRLSWGTSLDGGCGKWCFYVPLLHWTGFFLDVGIMPLLWWHGVPV